MSVQKETKEKSVLVRVSRMRKFEEILELGQISASSLGLRSFQKEVSKLTKKILQCQIVHLYIFQEKDNRLVRDEWIKDGKEHRRIKFKVDPSTFVGTCASEHNTLNLTDVQSDIRYKRLGKSLQTASIQSMLLAPMILQGSLVGVIEAINSDKEQFDEEDEFFMDAVCNQVSIVLNNFKLIDGIQRQFLQIVQAMADAVGKKDTYTGGHTKRVAHFAEMIGKEMDLSHTDMNDLKLASVLHDVGKIGIEDKVLKKTSPLTDEEFSVMKNHPRLGFEILGHIDGLEKVIDGMRFHHERPDGKGYPYGLRDGEIPLIAAIISVADAFDAMISTRPYSKGKPPMVAYQEVIDHRGTQFDERVVDAFVKSFQKTKMYKTLPDKKAA